MAIDYNEFEFGVRGFLNVINGLEPSSSSRVLTLSCNGASLGNHELSAPLREGGASIPFWIDFNRGELNMILGC